MNTHTERALGIGLMMIILCVSSGAALAKSAQAQSIKAPPSPPSGNKCAAYLGTEFPIPGASLTYTQAGHEIIRHYFLRMVDSNNIAIATYVPVYKNNRITGYTSYIQYVNTVTRLVIYRSSPSPYEYAIGPGDLPVGQYTDLWIPKTTQVGDHLPLYAATTMVGMESDTLWYVGDQSPYTTYGTKSYSKNAGVFLYTNTPTPSKQLAGGILYCTPKGN